MLVNYDLYFGGFSYEFRPGFNTSCHHTREHYDKLSNLMEQLTEGNIVLTLRHLNQYRFATLLFVELANFSELTAAEIYSNHKYRDYESLFRRMGANSIGFTVNSDVTIIGFDIIA